MFDRFYVILSACIHLWLLIPNLENGLCGAFHTAQWILSSCSGYHLETEEGCLLITKKMERKTKMISFQTLQTAEMKYKETKTPCVTPQRNKLKLAAC